MKKNVQLFVYVLLAIALAACSGNALVDETSVPNTPTQTAQAAGGFNDLADSSTPVAVPNTPAATATPNRLAIPADCSDPNVLYGENATSAELATYEQLCAGPLFVTVSGNPTMRPQHQDLWLYYVKGIVEYGQVVQSNNADGVAIPLNAHLDNPTAFPLNSAISEQTALARLSLLRTAFNSGNPTHSRLITAITRLENELTSVEEETSAESPEATEVVGAAPVVEMTQVMDAAAFANQMAGTPIPGVVATQPAQGAAPIQPMVAIPQGAVTLTLHEEFPNDLVDYFDDADSTPSGPITDNEPHVYNVGTFEVITCNGGGYTFIGLPIPQITGTANITFVNAGAPVSFTMSANVNTWCTRGGLTGSAYDAAVWLSGFYIRQLFADGADAVGAHIIINERTESRHWAGDLEVIDVPMVLTDESIPNFAPQAMMAPANWDEVEIAMPGPLNTLDERLRNNWLIYELPVVDCKYDMEAPVNNVQNSCSSQEGARINGEAILADGRGVRINGDGVQIHIDPFNPENIINITDDLTLWYFMLNISGEDVPFRVVCPSGCDISYFDLAPDGAWNADTVAHIFSLGMKLLHGQRGEGQLTQIETDNVTPIAITATPVPNCGNLPEGCIRSANAGILFEEAREPQLLFYGDYHQDFGFRTFAAAGITGFENPSFSVVYGE